MSPPLDDGWLRLRARARRVNDDIDPRARRRRAAFRELRDRFYVDVWTRAAQAVGATVEPLGDGFLRVRRAGAATFVRRSEVMLDTHLSLEIAGNKPLTHRLLAGDGDYRAPAFRTFDLASVGDAEAFLRERGGGAVVVKPASGSGGGRGITTGVRTGRALRRAAVRAAQFGRPLLVEEQVEGRSYRLLFLAGRFVHAVRRDRPIVVGDGARTIAALMRDETERRLRDPEVTALSPLAPDLDALLFLRERSLSVRSVPRAGDRVEVKRVVNQNAAAQNHTVDRVHPSIVALGQRIARALGLELMGLDVIAPDVSAPLAESGGVVNEVNTTPGLHHHLLVSDRAAAPPVPAMVLDHVLARSGGRR